MSKYIDYRYMYYKRLQNIKVNFKVRTKIFLASTITWIHVLLYSHINGSGCVWKEDVPFKMVFRLIYRIHVVRNKNEELRGKSIHVYIYI